MTEDITGKRTAQCPGPGQGKASAVDQLSGRSREGGSPGPGEQPSNADLTRSCLILGLGNDLLRDDAIGLRIATALSAWEGLPRGFVVQTTTEMGLSLLDFIVGFERLVLIDSIQTHQSAPGTIHVFRQTDLPTLPVVSPHLCGIGEVLSLGRTLGMAIPSKVVIIAIEVADPFTVSTGLSPELEELVPGILRDVQGIILADHSQASGG